VPYLLVGALPSSKTAGSASAKVKAVLVLLTNLWNLKEKKIVCICFVYQKNFIVLWKVKSKFTRECLKLFQDTSTFIVFTCKIVSEIGQTRVRDKKKKIEILVPR
jgi:hypothetical protein